MAISKDRLGQRRYTPRGSPAKPVGRLSDAGIVRPALARHNVIFLQVTIRRSTRSKIGKKNSYTLACSMRATSEPTIRSGVRHQGTTTGYQPIYENIPSNLVNFKAKSKSTTLRQEMRVTDSLTLHSIDKSIKHRVGGYT